MNLTDLRKICEAATQLDLPYEQSLGPFRDAFTPDFCKKLVTVVEKMQLIASLDPEIHSDEGYNEWGEAECFGKAKAIAQDILAALEGEQP